MALQRISGAMVSDSTITGSDVKMAANGTDQFAAGAVNISWE